jgi:hypothetical protein
MSLIERCFRERVSLLSSIPLAIAVPDGLTNDFRQGLDQVVDLGLDPIKTRPDGGEIVAVAPRLFEDVAGDHLLALDLAFKNADAGFEFLAGDIAHSGATVAACLLFIISQVALTSRRYSAASFLGRMSMSHWFV